MSLESRVARLESHNRILRIGCLFALVAGFMPWMVGSNPAVLDSISAKAFVLYDDDEARRGVWACQRSDGTAKFMMYAGDNRKPGGPFASFVVNEDRARISVFGNSGENEQDDGTGASLDANKEYASLFVDGGPNAAMATVVARRSTSELKLVEGRIIINENGQDVFLKPEANDSERKPAPAAKDTFKNIQERQEHETAIASISTAIKTLGANVAKNKELLKPIESRIFRNTLKNDKSLKTAIEKDKARAQEYKDTIAADEKRIAELKAKLAKEQQAMGEGNQP